MDKKRLIPYEKLSKKEKRRLDARKRAGWGGLSPVTRKVESKKHYSRKRSRDRYEDTGGSAFFMDKMISGDGRGNRNC